MNSKIKGTLHIVMAVILLLSVLGGAGISRETALADGITVTRTLPATVAPGETFSVSITFTAPADEFNSLVLHDEAPAGWQVAVDTGDCTPSAMTGKIIGVNGMEYSWLGPFNSGETITAVYDVTVPAGATSANYTFPDGWLVYYIVGDDYLADITGDTQVNIDITPPTVTSTDPDWGATDVSLDTTIQVTFDETMNTVTAEGAFYISPEASGTFSWDTNTMIFTPDSDLASNTLYDLTISMAAQDLAGNSMGSPYMWFFTTEGIAPPEITTGAADEITEDSATLHATLDSMGDYVSLNVSFVWGPDTQADPVNYPYETTPEAMTTTGAFSAPLSGLNPDTTYYYRAKATGSVTVYGGEENFTTEQVPGITVTRNVPEQVLGKASEDTTFQYTVNFTAPDGGFNSIGLTDTSPAGWDIAVDTAWCTPTPNFGNIPTPGTAQYAWITSYTAGTEFNAVFEVTVPAGTPAGYYDFTDGTIEYYIGGDGPYTAPVTGDDQIEVVHGSTINGTIAEVNCVAIPGATVELYESALLVDSATSDQDGNYELLAPDTGSYTVTAKATSFKDESQPITITGLGEQYSLDFRGNHGLIPKAPNMSYVLQCANRWLFPPADPACALSMSRVLAVANAWLFPQSQGGSLSTSYPASYNPADALTVTRTLPGPGLHAGDTFDVTVTFSAPEDDFNSVGITDIAPAGWDVAVNTAWCTPTPFFGHIPTPGTIQYAWLAYFAIDTEFTIIYQVTVPAEATPGIYTFPGGNVEYYIGGTGPSTANITGDNVVILDITPPTITATDPADDATDVSVDTTIQVTFDEAMDTTSAEGAFSIDPSVSGTFTWDSSTMIFTPDSDLATNTLYTATVGTGAEDLAGNPMAAPYEWSFTTEKLPPEVTTGSATDITTDSATLNGNLDSLGDYTSVKVSFEYGETQSGPYTGETTPEELTATGAFSSPLIGLDSNTRYYYRAKSQGAITVYGDEEYFDTGKLPPEVTTGTPTGITDDSAILWGTLDSLGDYTSVDLSFEYGETQGGPYPDETDSGAQTATGDFSRAVIDLDSDTAYYYRAKAVANGEVVYGDEESFTTPIVVVFPDAHLEAAVRDAIAKPAGDIYDTDLLGLTVFTADNLGITDLIGLEYCVNLTSLSLRGNQISDISPIQGLTNLKSLKLQNNQINNITSLSGLTSLSILVLHNNVISDISPLEDLTAMGTLGLGGNQINDISPLADLIDLVSLGIADNQINDISPLANLINLVELQLPDNQINDITTLALLTNLWYLDLEHNQVSDILPLVANIGISDGDIIHLRYNQLSPESLYIHVPALIARGVTVTYDDQPVDVTTNVATDITDTTATLQGYLDSLGAHTSMDVSFVWGTESEADPADYPNETSPEALSATGAFSTPLSGLESNTRYYYRAKAEGVITVYGDEQFFDTEKTSPEVTTEAASGLTTDEATLNMSYDFNDYGSGEVRFAYKESTAGTWTYTSWVAASGSGSYAEVISSLTSNTDYDFKAQLKYDSTEIEGTVEQFTTEKVPPEVTTEAASGVTTDEATLNGNLDSLGDYTSVNVTFEWGDTSGGPYSDETTPEAMSASGSFSALLSGLDSNTTYYYRAKAVANGEVVYGEEESFTTDKLPPEITTGTATNITTSSATLNGNLDSIGDYPGINVSFKWGETPGGPYPNETTQEPLTETGAFSTPLSGLDSNTRYYFRARADTGTGIVVNGDEQFFDTEKIPPEVTTGTATGITTDSAILWGNLDSLGDYTSVDLSFEYGETQGGPYTDETDSGAQTAPGDFSRAVIALDSDTTYYYRAKAVANGEVVYGDEESFMTEKLPPEVTTGAATGVTTDESTLNMSYDFNDYGSGEVRFAYKESTEGTWTYTSWVAASDSGSYLEVISGLSSDTLYDFKAQLKYDSTEIEGTAEQFTTEKVTPEVTTEAATGVTTEEATLNLSYDFNDYGSGEVRFAYKKSDEGIWTNTTWVPVSGSGSYSEGISGMDSNEDYDFKAQLKYDSTEIEGTVEQFTTEKVPPEVTTGAAADITDIAATLHGSLDDMGDYKPISVSFEYGKISGTLDHETTPTESMTATGDFSFIQTGLDQATTYYYRAKATGSVTVYGDEETFTTYANPPTVWVDDDWAGYTPGDTVDGHEFGHNAFATIQEGINAVEPGIGTVNVYEGTYTENLIVPESVTIQSINGAGVTIIEPVMADHIPAMMIDTWNAQIIGFTIIAYPGNLYGINLPYVQQCSISDCIITGFSTGIRLYNAENNILVNNHIQNNDTGIDLDDASFNIIENNVIQDNKEGIALNNSHDNEFIGNDILNNASTTSGIHLDGSPTGNVIHFNNIAGNLDHGVSNFNTSENVSARNNWWGDASGPGGAGPGAGDNVTMYVDYTPWLTAEVGDCTSESVSDDTLDATEEADTTVEVSGTAKVTVAEYTGNPASGFGGDIGKYVDVCIDDDTGVDEIEIRLYYTDAEIAGKVESTLKLYWYNSANSTWEPCSHTGVEPAPVNGYSGYIWATINGTTTTPLLSDLIGTPFGATAGQTPAPPAPEPPTGGGGGGGGSGRGVTVLSNDLTPEGKLTRAINAVSSDLQVYLMLTSNTYCKGSQGETIHWISILAVPEDEPVPAPPEGSEKITPCYEMEPGGAQFDPPATCIFKYGLWELPEGVNEESFTVMTWDKVNNQWIPLESRVDTEEKTVSTLLGHFSLYAVMTVSRPAAFELSGLAITPSEIEVNEDATVTVTVTNTGDLSGSYDVILKLNGGVVATKTVTLDGLESETVSFTVKPETDGEYTVSIGNTSGTLKVTEAPSPPPETPSEPTPEPASFTVSEVSASPEEVAPNEEVTITYRVSNTGGTEGSYTIALKINDAEEDSRVVTLGAGLSELLTFTVARDSEGTYMVDCNGETCHFIVTAPQPPATEPVEAVPIEPAGTNWGIIGGIIAACVVLAGLAGFYIWRRRSTVKAEETHQ